jgi:ABC-2 type transport system ATP-binding protein
MTELAIEVHGLRRSYGDVHALQGIDLEVVHGECFAVLGPNGAGKSTAVEILEGYRHRDGGEVRVLGTDPAEGGAQWRSRLGIVLQQARDLADLTVRESVRHFAAYYPDPRDVDEVIEAVGLTAKRDARGDTLSGGQRRRLDVALGIVGRPELLFLDEPTTGFDPQARRDFWQLVEQLKAGGTTTVLTTHYLEEAQELADRLAVISSGRVVACDTPDALGGRASAAATVSWLDSDGPHQQQTAEPTRTVQELAARFGGEVPELAVVRPTLEDVYLELVGGQGGES